MLKLVLPDETDFVLTAYELQWNESNTLLDRIEVKGLAPRIEALVGDEYLPAIRDAHRAFGDALGLGDTPFTPERGVSISAAIEALAIAIAEYGRLMAGQLDRNDPASVAAFKTAMAPIDAYRKWLSSRHEDAEPAKPQPSPENPVVVEGDVQPTDPVPPIPGT